MNGMNWETRAQRLLRESQVDMSEVAGAPRVVRRRAVELMLQLGREMADARAAEIAQAIVRVLPDHEPDYLAATYRAAEVARSTTAAPQTLEMDAPTREKLFARAWNAGVAEGIARAIERAREDTYRVWPGEHETGSAYRGGLSHAAYLARTTPGKTREQVLAEALDAIRCLPTSSQDARAMRRLAEDALDDKPGG